MQTRMNRRKAEAEYSKLERTEGNGGESENGKAKGGDVMRVLTLALLIVLTKWSHAVQELAVWHLVAVPIAHCRTLRGHMWPIAVNRQRAQDAPRGVPSPRTPC